MAGYADILKQVDIFYQFTQAQLELVSHLAQDRTYYAGDTVFAEGSLGNELYVIAQGEVDILVDPSLVSDQPDIAYTPVTIATLRRGQSFGEIALVDQGIRSAAARVTQNDTRLLIFPHDKIFVLCENNPELGYRLMRNLAADLGLKIRSTNMRIREDILHDQLHK